MPAPLSERYADLANLLGAYFPGDDALDAEVEEMVAGLDTHHLDQFENDAAELLADDEVSEDELDAFVADGPNWDFGGGRATLAELLARVRAARGTDTESDAESDAESGAAGVLPEDELGTSD
jgi:hypothetical protein